MKKKLIIAIIIILFLIGFIFISSMAVQKAFEYIKNNDFYLDTDEYDDQALIEMADKYTAIYWTDELKAPYSYLIEKTLNELKNINILFEGELIDIRKDGDLYYIYFDDDNLYNNSNLSIIYKLTATHDQVELLIENDINEFDYYYYIIAAKFNSIESFDIIDNQSYYNIIIHGDFLDGKLQVWEDDY